MERQHLSKGKSARVGYGRLLQVALLKKHVRLVASSSFAACVLLLCSLPAVGASILPDASVTGTVLFNLSGRKDLAGFGSIALTDARFGFVGFTASGTPSPSLVANAEIGPNDLIPSIFGRGTGALNYVFEITGPPGEVPVLIDVAGIATGLASPGASFAVKSRWALFDSVSLRTLLAGDDIRSGQLTGSFSQNFNRRVSLTLTTNHIYPVFMLADAEAAATAEGSSAGANAFVDPTFSFGPGIDPRAYSFHFSDGIGNSRAAAVPEPATMLLLATGLASLCSVKLFACYPRSLMRRRRVKKSVAQQDQAVSANLLAL